MLKFLNDSVTSLLLILIFATTSCSPSEQPIKPVRKDITQAVYASGKVFPASYYKANVSIPGYIKNIFVEVGDTVKKGQPLFSIKNDVSDYSVNVAKNNMELAAVNSSDNSAYLKALRDDVAAAKAKLELDSVNFERFKNLQEQSAATQVAFDQSKTQYQTSKRAYNKALNLLKSASLKAETDLKNAKNQYEAQLSTKNDFTIYSSINGKVYDIAGKEGELVGPQVPVMELGGTDKYEVELAVDETDVNFIHEGQEVVYATEAFDQSYFLGKIRQVYPKISNINKSIKAMATIDLPQNMRLYAGSTIEANVIFARKKNALVIPKFYVKNDSVRVVKNKKKKKIKVKTGIQDMEYVEILAGLDEQTEILKP